MFNVPEVLLILAIEHNGCTRSTYYSICRLNFAEVNAMGKLNKYLRKPNYRYKLRKVYETTI